MNPDRNQGNLCKGLCWLFGLVFGAYFAYILVTDFGLGSLTAAVLGLVAMLVVGFGVRLVFCRNSGNLLEIRIREAAERSTGTEKRTAQLAAQIARHKSSEQMAEAEAAASAAAVLAAMAKEDDIAQPAEAVTITDTPPEPAEPAPLEQVKEPQGQQPEPPVMETASDGAVAKKEITPKRPRGLKAPLQGGADDLSQIDGIGPEIQSALNEIGIFHFTQFTKMTRREIVWLDGNLPGVDGRASRDKWKKQSRILAAAKSAAGVAKE